MSSSNVLGVGVIGFGFMGKTHTMAHRCIPFMYDPPPVRTRMVAVCRGRSELADEAKATGGFERACQSAEELIASPDIDIVHICTPNAEHMRALRLAIAANKHIYVDKPVTANLAEADELEKLLPGYRGVAQVAMQCRFFPATMKARHLVDEGFLGPVTHFRAAHLHSGNVDENRPADWKQTAAAGGGVIRDLGPHVLDLVNWLIGPFDGIQCVSRIWAAERPSAARPEMRVKIDVEDAAIMLLRKADGALGTVESSKIATGTEDELRFEIHGRHGAMRFNMMQPNYLEIYDGRLPEGELGGRRGWQRLACVQKYPSPGGKFPPGKNAIGWLRGHVHGVYEFLRAIAHGRPAEPGLKDGIAMQRMLEAARESAATGRCVGI